MKKEDLSHQLQTILLDHDQPPENLKKALDAFFEPDCIALADQFTQLAQQSSGVATGTLYETLATDIQSHGIAFVGKLSNAFTRINILTVNYNDALEEILNASTRLERFCNEKYDWDGKFYRIRDRERQEIDPVADFIHTRLSWACYSILPESVERDRRRSAESLWDYNWDLPATNTAFESKRAVFLQQFEKEKPLLLARIEAVRTVIPEWNHLFANQQKNIQHDIRCSGRPTGGGPGPGYHVQIGFPFGPASL